MDGQMGAGDGWEGHMIGDRIRSFREGRSCARTDSQACLVESVEMRMLAIELVYMAFPILRRHDLWR